MSQNGHVAVMSQHTMSLPLDGYDRLHVTHDLGLSWQQVNAMRDAGQLAPTIVDFPNWTEVADELGLPEIKPDLPLTMDALYGLPMRLTAYLVGDDMIRDALTDERTTRRPFSKTR